MSTKFQRFHKKNIFVLLLITCLITLNHFLRHYIYPLGMQQTIKIQHQISHQYLKLLTIVTTFINPLTIFLLSTILLILTKQKKKGIILILFILFNILLISIVKQLYSDPRPYWTDISIQNLQSICYHTYGTPSAHSWFSPIACFIFIQYFGLGKYNLNAIISIIIIIFAPLTRMWLGLHSLDQIIFGTLMGICMSMLFISGFNHDLQLFMLKFRENKLLIICLFIITILSFFISNNHQLPQTWLINFNNKCSSILNPSTNSSVALTFKLFCLCVSFGIGLGYKQLTSTYNSNLYLNGKWIFNQQQYGKYLVKFWYVTVELGLILIPFVVLAIWNKMLQWNYNLLYCLTAFISSYLYISKSAKYLLAYRIIKSSEQCNKYDPHIS